MGLLLTPMTGCVMDSHDMSHLALGAKRQPIDLDVNHWVRFSFAYDAGSVAIKIPPAFRTFSESTLPARAYGAHSQRLLFDAQYDYRSRSIEDLAELDIRASYIRLSQPVPTEGWNVEDLDRALRMATGQELADAADPKPAVERVAGRHWMHIDQTMSQFAETTCESYVTLLNPNTTFMLGACYSPQIRRNAGWLESRRQLLRQILDQVGVTSP
jgi:hypothetical protein